MDYEGGPAPLPCPVTGRHLRDLIPDSSDIAAAIAALEGRAPERVGVSPPPETEEEPIFILAVGWGSGSTLLQRVLMTDRRAIVWGEPFGRMGLVGSLTRALTAIDESWPRDRHFAPFSGEDRVARQVANMHPAPRDLFAGYRALLQNFLGDSARSRGAERWGLKEVRLCAPDAVVLHHLFPSARFVVLYRHPVDAWRSSRSMRILWRFDTPIEGATQFAHLWTRMVETWNEAPGNLPVLHLRYEDLTAGTFDFGPLARHVGLELDPARALSTRTGARGATTDLPDSERDEIQSVALEGMARLGYSR